ncbi:MAG: FUSC family protein [Pseudomonadota bacterium]
MSASSVPAASAESAAVAAPPGRLHSLLAETSAWAATQAPVIVHMIKLTVAVLLAMGITLRLDFAKPTTAMLTVVIVMHQRSGLVLAKSFYRFLGTIAGVITSVVLAALFSQEAVLFIVAGACWLALCTAGSAIFRNFQSYAFVLAGYTLVIVGLPAALQPDQAFDIAVVRLTEVMLGILCAGVVSDLIFPQRVTATLLAMVRQRFGNFARYISRENTDAATSERTMLKFIGEVISFESLRSASVFENAGHPSHGTQLSLLNTAFMTVSTTFHTLDLLFMRLQNAGKQVPLDALLDRYRAITALLNTEPAAAAEALSSLRLALPAQLARARTRVLAAAGPNVNPSALLDFDSAIELLLRFCDELQNYSRIQASVLSGAYLPEKELSAAIDYVAATDPLLVFFAGLRSATVFALTCAFWIYSGWASGVDAIVLGTVFGGLFSSVPSPSRAVKQFIIGALGGTAAAFISAYYLQPYAENFTMLSLAIAPFLMIGAWFSNHPKYGGIGAGMLIFFISYAAIDSAYVFDFLTLVNSVVGGLIGVGVAAVMFVIIDPVDSRWVKQRLARALRLKVVEACNKPLPGLLPLFESSTRDLLQRFIAIHALDNEDDREVLAWLLSVLEIGRATIQLRQDVANNNALTADETAAAKHCIDAISALFNKPDEARRQAAIDATLQEIATCKGRAALLAHLHLIRASLLDEKSVLANYAPPLVALSTQKAEPHA